MVKQRGPTPEIQFIAPPPIKWYGVSGDQLDRIEEACSHVGLDFTFALTSLSIGVTTLVTGLSLPQLTDQQKYVFVGIMILCSIIFLYTGIRWLVSRNRARSMIKAIKRQSDQPEGQ